MGHSLESSRPIMAPSVSSSSPTSIEVVTNTLGQLASKRASTRFSTYSMAPTLTPSLTPSLEAAQQEINHINEGLDKLENKKLASQRFVPSEKKVENLDKLALGAKLERALDRRLGGQDAVMRVKKPLSEKPSVENEKIRA
jgi:hypothetical protein